MEKIKKGFYVGLWLAGYIGFWLLLSIGMPLMIISPKFAPVGVILYLFSLAFLILSVVMGMMLLYKMWAAVQGPSARTTPGKAVGFLFIPFFNLYWIFQAYWGWAVDYNKMVKERQVNAPLMPQGLALTLSIFHIITIIPYIGLLFILPYTILMIVFFVKGTGRVNNLVDAGIEPQQAEVILPNENAKTSGLAVSSLILGILGFFTVGLAAITGLILGIVGMNSIKKSSGNLKGRGLALSGIITSSVALILMPMMLAIIMPALAKTRNLAQRIMCGTNLKGLGEAVLVYAGDDKYERYPTASKWCDLLVEYADVPAESFRCPGVSEGKCNYAMNKYIEDSNMLPDIVLLFETEPGWNQFGGPEILSTENHRGDGCNIMFGDGHIRFVRTEEIDSLKWTNDPNR